VEHIPPPRPHSRSFPSEPARDRQRSTALYFFARPHPATFNPDSVRTPTSEHFLSISFPPRVSLIKHPPPTPASSFKRHSSLLKRRRSPRPPPAAAAFHPAFRPTFRHRWPTPSDRPPRTEKASR
jgi:hypothetical protein